MAQPAKSHEPGQPRGSGASDEEYLLTLETVKKQYEEYVEISDIFNLPYRQNETQVTYQPPGKEHPLTSNTIHLK